MTDTDLIKSPLNYIGGKKKIAKQIINLFPNNINTFIDLFAGGCNIGINVKAQKIILNDNLIYLIELYKSLRNNSLDNTLSYIEKRITELDLSLVNKEGYIKLREYYNKDKNPLDLLVLIFYSFNHQIRFNNNHQFNNPFGKDRSCFNSSIKKNLERFVNQLQILNIEFSNITFDNFELSNISTKDFVYCDPPYLITRGTYNDGKRGFTGWGIKEELTLLKKLDYLTKNKVKFALSNVLIHKGKQNMILKEWLDQNKSYIIYHIDSNYSNSNYQTIIRDKNSTKEVLITNYAPKLP